MPRMGQEVIVDFFEGDPDQPLVVGRVFNNTTKVPRKLPDHDTQSIWRTASSPQTDGYFNEIMMDDKCQNHDESEGEAVEHDPNVGHRTAVRPEQQAR